ncbi:MAG: tetratricopeptide repeat protein [Anaeromyxobacter sp.]
MPAPGLLLASLAWAAAAAAAPGQASRCERGAADGCREAGRELLSSADPRDARLGTAYVALACEMGDPPACAHLGALHALGRGVSFDAVRATALSRRACEAGVAFACANWAALVAEDAGGPARLAGAQAVDVVRKLRAACEAGAPEGCLDLAVALEAGTAGKPDQDGASVALVRACDAGLAIACHRLALVWSDEDTARPLRARACRAAIAPACAVAGLPVPPAGPSTPSPRLAEDPGSLALAVPGTGGVHPADLAGRAVGTVVSGSQAEGDAAVALLLPARKLELAPCLDAARAAPARPVRLELAFVVEADGRAGEVRASTDPPEPALEACASEVALDWSFPAGPARAGPFAVRLDVDPFPGGVAPLYPGATGARPAPREPGCVAAALRAPADTVARTLTFKLAVDPEGRASLVAPLTAAPEPLLEAASRAIRSCRFTPGSAAGRPAPVWTTMTLRIGGG